MLYIIYQYIIKYMLVVCYLYDIGKYVIITLLGWWRKKSAYFMFGVVCS